MPRSPTPHLGAPTAPCPRARSATPSSRAGGPDHGRGPGHHRGDRPGAGPPRPTLLIVSRSGLPPERESAETAALTTRNRSRPLSSRGCRVRRPPAGLVERVPPAHAGPEIQTTWPDDRAGAHYYSADATKRVRRAARPSSRNASVPGRVITAGSSGTAWYETRRRSRSTASSDQGGRRPDPDRTARPARLRFCAFFASVASRFGNKGQSDYAAANEVLSKLALLLDRRWPARVFSVAWGPWSEIGMVADLEAHLVRRGLRLISPQEGPELFVAELLHGRKGRQIILAGGAEALARPPTRSRPLPPRRVNTVLTRSIRPRQARERSPSTHRPWDPTLLLRGESRRA